MIKTKQTTIIQKGNTLINVLIKFTDTEITVGKLILDGRQIHFKYDTDFLKLGLNLSPLKLKFNDNIQIAPPTPFNGLFGLFDDSLPDGWGKLLLNRALEKKGLSLMDINSLDHLANIGDTGKGALIYRPAILDNVFFEDTINLDELKTVMDNVYHGTSSEVIEELLALGGSSGGARPKANVGYNPQTNTLIHGHNILPEGYSHWIIKFPNSEDPKDIANIEYAYSKMARLAKIEMSNCLLLKSKNGSQFFATKRFDRIGNNRLHMHSMAGLTNDNFRLSTIDYGHIIDTAYQLDQTAKARETILRLAAFNIYSHNLDDHSKNFSWLMDEFGNWIFAPAYDLTYSSSAINEHSTRTSGEGATPGRQQIIELAKEFSINKPNELIEEVQSAIAMWPKIATNCGVSKTSIKRIQNSLSQIKD